MMIEGPVQQGGHWVWRARKEGAEVLFTGRGPDGTREEILRRVAPEAPALAWAKQVHSSRALPAAPGECGEGDALHTRRTELALCVLTADCVPVLLAGPEGVAAVHAGWRGLAAGVIARTIEALDADPARWTAWIGPAIGACCYEVGYDVAARVGAVSAAEIVTPGPAGKPHLDLPGAARRQLEAAGVGEVLCLPRCTRCDEERLWSYRREGKAAGRNLAVVWRTSSVTPP